MLKLNRMPLLLNLPQYASEVASVAILNWFLENKQDFDINYKDCQGMTALDYAEDPQVISILISAGAIAYQASNQLTCVIDHYFNNEQLKAIERFLMFYNQGYEQNEEHEEFIFRLPQIKAEGFYQGKVIQIFQPLEEYWQEYISPIMQSYIGQFSQNKLTYPFIDELMCGLDQNEYDS